MTTLTLLVKALNFGQVKQIDELLKAEFEELDVEVEVLSNSQNRWIQVSLSGEDQAIAAAFINKEIGICPTSLESAINSPSLKGYISKVNLERKELVVDVGVFEPKPIMATVALATLQKQLLDGNTADLKTIAQAYALAERVPLIIKPLSSEGDMLQAELASEQVEKLKAWQQSLLDRLIILGASKETIEGVLERTRLTRDVIAVEGLGMFEFALTCKLGTYGAGLVSVLGRYLRNSVFVVFNAKNCFELLSEHTLTL